MANKDNLVDVVQGILESKEIKLNKKEMGKVVDSVLEGIVTTTLQDGTLKLVGFGNFEVRERSARKGRNPQTGEEIDIKASKSPAFKPGKTFKDAVK